MQDIVLSIYFAQKDCDVGFIHSVEGRSRAWNFSRISQLGAAEGGFKLRPAGWLKSLLFPLLKPASPAF